MAASSILLVVNHDAYLCAGERTKSHLYALRQRADLGLLGGDGAPSDKLEAGAISPIPNPRN
jgi:hypothetical protein